MNVRFKFLDPNAQVPRKGYPNSAGFDLYPLIAGIIPPRSRVNIPLGFATEFSPGFVALVDDRGGTGNSGLTHLAGVIDADYRGEWQVIIYNTTDEPYKYDRHKGIAQVMFIQIENPDFVTVDTLGISDRGDGKFGSSETPPPVKRIIELSAGNQLKIEHGTE